MTDPDKRYHLEFFTGHAAVSREVYALMLEMGLSPKDSRRGGGVITYFKQSEAIEDVLTTMGAPLAAMGVMQSKMQKDMRNAVNRRVNCDSTFKRPVGGYAAALIDRAGLKGYSVGAAQVSEKHAGFVVNRGGATFDDVLRLIEHIQNEVFRVSGIELEPEVKIIRG